MRVMAFVPDVGGHEAGQTFIDIEDVRIDDVHIFLTKEAKINHHIGINRVYEGVRNVLDVGIHVICLSVVKEGRVFMGGKDILDERLDSIEARIGSSILGLLGQKVLYGTIMKVEENYKGF